MATFRAARAGGLCLLTVLLGYTAALDCNAPGVADCTTCVRLDGCSWCTAGNRSGQSCGPAGSMNCPNSDMHFRGSDDGDRDSCNYQGTKCGDRCLCDDGFYGDNCGCEAESMNLCIPPNSKVPCNGRGDCVCGMCQCHPTRPRSSRRYSGMFCECNDHSCPFHYGQMCGGHGMCRCGVCACEADFTGEACQCPYSADGSPPLSCLASNGVECNGRGICECGRCRCTGRILFGPTCEDCPTCPVKCVQYKQCVLCRYFNSGPFTSEECSNDCMFSNTKFSVTDQALSSPTGSGDTRECTFIDREDKCRYNFQYTYVNGLFNVLVSTVKECPPPEDGSQKSSCKGQGHDPLSFCFALLLNVMPHVW